MTSRVVTDETTPMLQMRGIDKRFPGVVANDNVDFDVRAGEVHALLGENGAGKSTLMKILFGLYRPDRGEVLLHGKPLRLRSPHDAIKAGVGMIHQHFMLVPTLTVTENVALGLERNPFARVDLSGVARRITELSDTYHLGIDPDAQCWQLAVGERQRVEILKVLYRKARLLVLDEPTAVLTPGEVDELLRTLRRIADDGCGLIFISHKLREAIDFADRITVMRDGAVTGEVLPAETSLDQLAQLMVGRPVKLIPDKAPCVRGPAVLSVSDLTVAGDRRQVAVDAVTLEVCAGEVVGIAGVSGNGQRELADAIAGLRPAASGTIQINGVDTTNNSPRASRIAGLAYVPEERMREGAIGDFSVWENLILLNHAESVERVARVPADAGNSPAGSGARVVVCGQDSESRHAGPVAVGWQHPEDDHGPRDVGGRQRVDRLAAHSRCRHRRSRIHPRPADRRSRGRCGGSAHLRGTRRSARNERSHRRDVRGPPRGDARSQ